ncbi:MAG TPA: ankyrin repeat domain-containing protein, partial [Bacillaceae bacterium]
MSKWITAILSIFLIAGCSQSSEGKKEEQQMNSQHMVTAAENGDLITVKNLLDQGADINQTDESGRTPIMAATYAHETKMVEYLLSNGADINKRDHMKNNPFLYAGAEGYNDILELLIEAEPDTKLVNRYGGTALIPAAERGHVG